MLGITRLDADGPPAPLYPPGHSHDLCTVCLMHLSYLLGFSSESGLVDPLDAAIMLFASN